MQRDKSELVLSYTSAVITTVCVCVMAFLFSGTAIAQSGSHSVSKVEIVGTRRIDVESVKEQLQIGAGAVSSEQITQEVKRLYETGFFDQVTASIVHESSQVAVLQYTVVEKPTVRKVFVKGNEEVSEKDLSEVLDFGTMRFLDRARIDSLMRNAKTLYESRGYYDAEFEYSVVPIGENQVDLTFEVSEGERYYIGEIAFRGLEHIDEDDLIDVMQTSEYAWYSSWLLGTGRLNREMLLNDRNLMRQYFFDNGYIDVVVSEPAIEKADQELVITFDITEGAQYSIGDIGVSGDLKDVSPDKALEKIESEIGSVFNASQLREDSFVVSDVFTDIGFAYANVVPDTKIDRVAETVDVDFVVDPGQPVNVRRVKIKGNEKTYDHVIRRELRVDEQELYSSSKVRRSQQLLERLGYFEEVNVSSEPTGADDLVDLLVSVREGSTGSFSAGAGFSSSEGALFNARLSENNIFGTGRRVVINADLGDERENLVLTLGDRRLFDTHVSGSVDLLKTEREFTDFDRSLNGAGFTLGYPLEWIVGESGEDMEVSLKYEYLDIEISNVDPLDAADLVIASEGKASSSGFTPRFERNTINNPLNPTSGSRQTFSVELTGLGGTEKYYLIDGRHQWYYPLLEGDWGEFVFSHRMRLGFGKTFDGDDMPLFRRFFPGGINSVRGFESRTLGPKDDRGNEYGGSKQFINNFEVIFPIVNSAGLRGVAFFDAGEAFDDDESISFGELRQAYGFGLRWTSPLGPIRVEFGFPLDREDDEKSMVTLFSFGAPL